MAQGGDEGVVEADERHVTGHCHAGVGQTVERSGREQVVEGEDGGGRVFLRQQRVDDGQRVGLVVTRGSDVDELADACGPHARLVARAALRGGRVAPAVHMDDAGVAQRGQVLNG